VSLPTPQPDQRDVVGIVLNPTAGGGRAAKLLPAVVATLRRLSCPRHLHVTTAPREATTVARQFAADGVSLVVAVGGDGTVNEVANGLLEACPGATLGVLPAGRGADFARSVGSPRNADAALERIVRATPRRIDIGRATFADGSSRAFVNVAGLGFDAAVAERATGSRLPGSTVPYVSGLLGALACFHNLDVVIEVDGERIDGRALSVVVANGRYFGGGMKIVPDADLADGMIDLAVLGDLSKRNLLRNVPRVYRGNHVSHPKFTHRTARVIRVTTTEPARVQLDGEVVGEAPVTFAVEPGALWLAG